MFIACDRALQAWIAQGGNGDTSTCIRYKRKWEKGLHWERGALTGLQCSLILAVWRGKNPIILNHIKLTEHGLVFSFMFLLFFFQASLASPSRARPSPGGVRWAGAKSLPLKPYPLRYSNSEAALLERNSWRRKAKPSTEKKWKQEKDSPHLSMAHSMPYIVYKAFGQ